MIKPYYEHSGITIYHGDCRDVVTGIPKVDTIFTDPPYGINFMGKEWDHGVPGYKFFELFKLASKPGAMLLAFGGTRTFHRLTCAIEDAGWQIRDCLMWLYGSGFPKSLDISKAIDKAKGAEREVIGQNKRSGKERGTYNDFAGDSFITEPETELAKQWSGWGTALKPAWEPIILAMKPLDGTFAENAEKHGVAGLNIDGCRIGTSRPASASDPLKFKSWKETDGCERSNSNNPDSRTNVGRWPANLILDKESAEMLDEQSGKTIEGNGKVGGGDGKSKGLFGLGSVNQSRYPGTGSASRFFYIAKSSNDDRGNKEELDMPLFNAIDPGLKNIHPTVKPLELMEKLVILQTYLCRLTSTPTGGIILDPFMGSGSTLIAAKRSGRSCIGIEKEEKYCEVAAKRLQSEPSILVSKK